MITEMPVETKLSQGILEGKGVLCQSHCRTGIHRAFKILQRPAQSTAVEPAKGCLEEETDIDQGNGNGIGFIFAWL